MGTNFFLVQSNHKDVEEGVHIGKRSAGWVFHFQASEEIKTLAEMKEFTKHGTIYDEYERPYTYEQFWKEVEETKLPDPDGEPKWVLIDPNYPNDNVYGDYEESGFAWSPLDFR